MVDRTLIAYLKLAHGSYNLSMAALFCYQAILGLRIRKARLSGAAFPLEAVRRHRRTGPILALCGVLGFAAGVGAVLLDKGRVFEYPLHFAVGAAIAANIGSLAAVSRRIAGAGGAVRDAHFGLGVLLLALYVIQSFLGLSILL